MPAQNLIVSTADFTIQVVFPNNPPGPPEEESVGGDPQRLYCYGTLSYAALLSAFEAHRWFDLRDAVLSGNAPPVYRLLTDAAFNDLPGVETEWKKKLAGAGASKEQLPTHTPRCFASTFAWGGIGRRSRSSKRWWPRIRAGH
jgi:hypothetical protein